MKFKSIFIVLTVLLVSFGFVSAASVYLNDYTIGSGEPIFNLWKITDYTNQNMSIWSAIDDLNTSINDRLNNVSKIDFNKNPTINTSEGTLYWDAADKTLALRGEDWTLQIGQEQYLLVYNDNSYTIENGHTVTQNGQYNGYPTVAYADSASIYTGIVLGVSTQSILPGQTGMITILGIVHNVNTSLWIPGTTLYTVSGGATGDLTDVKPIGGATYPMSVGQVIIQGDDGSMFIRSRTAEVDPYWYAEKVNYYDKTEIDNSIYGMLKNNSLSDGYVPYSANGTLLKSPIYYELTDEAYMNFFPDRVFYLDDTNGVAGINMPVEESHKANWQVTSKLVTGYGLLSTISYDEINDQTLVLNDINFSNNIDASSNVIINGTYYFVNEIVSENELYLRGNVSFTNESFNIKIAPYSDVFGPSNTERGYSISDDKGNWQWAMYIPDDSNNTKLCFQNRKYPTGDLFCLSDDGNMEVLGTLKAKGLDIGNSTIVLEGVKSQLINSTKIVLNGTDLQNLLDGKVNIIDLANYYTSNHTDLLLQNISNLISNLNQSLNEEIIGRQNNNSLIVGFVNNVNQSLIDEINARKNNDSSIVGIINNLNQSLIDEENSRKNNDSIIIGLINNNSNSLNLSINDEILARQNNDSHIIGLINNLSDDDSIYALNQSLTDEINSRKGNDSRIIGLINNNSNSLNQSINDEIFVRYNSDNLLQSRIDNLSYNSPFVVINESNETYLSLWNGMLYVDKTNGVAAINAPLGNESHEASFSVNSIYFDGRGDINSSNSEIIDGLLVTIINCNETLGNSLASATSLFVGNDSYYVVIRMNSTTFQIRGNQTINSNSWRYKPAPYSDVNGLPTEERGYSISSNGHYRWSWYVPDNVNDTMSCFSSSEYTDPVCMDTNGKLIVNGVLEAGALTVPKYAGFVLVPNITNNGDGSVNISDSTVNCYDGNDYANILRNLPVTGGRTGSEITALISNPSLNTLNYVVVDCDDGAPFYTILTDKSMIDNKRFLLLATMLRVNIAPYGEYVHIQSNTNFGTAMPERAYTKNIDTDRYAISTTSTLNLFVNGLNVSTGAFNAWAGYTKYTLPLTSQTTLGVLLYPIGNNNWSNILSQPPLLNNTIYSNGTNLVSLNDSYYGIMDVWKAVEDLDMLYTIPMNNQYSSFALADAETQLAPVPSVIKDNAIFVGRIIYKKGNQSDITVKVVSTNVKYTSSTAITNHNVLAGLQGCSGSDCYHLSAALYQKIYDDVYGIEITSINNSLQSEINARILNNTANKNRMDAINSSIVQEIQDRINNDTSINNRVTTINSSIVQEIQDRINNDTTINNRVTTINSSIVQEIQDRINNDTSLRNSDISINSSLQSEITGRINNDTSINNRVTTINSSIVQEIQDRINNDTSINNKFNSYNTSAQLIVLFNTLYYNISNPNGYLNNTGVVAAVGNWSLDKSNYLNSTADAIQDNNLVQTINTSANIKGLGFNLTSELSNLFMSISRIFVNSTDSDKYLYLSNNNTILINETALNSTISSIANTRAGVGSFNCSNSQLLANLTSNSSGVFGVCVTPSVSASAGGTNFSIQYNLNGAIAGATYADISPDGYFNTGVTNTTPLTPSSGIDVYGVSRGAETVLTYMGPSGVDRIVQAGLAYDDVRYYVTPESATTSTAPIAIGFTAVTPIGTITSSTVDGNSFRTSIPRTTLTSAAGLDELKPAVTRLFIGNSSKTYDNGGFKIVMRYAPTGPVDATTVGCFGFTGSVTAYTVANNCFNGTQNVNNLFAGWANSSTINKNLSYYSSNASGPPVKLLDCGIDYPVNTTTAFYETTIFATPKGGNVSLYTVRLDDTSIAPCVLTLPGTDKRLPAINSVGNWRLFMGRLGTAGTTGVIMEFSKMYVSKDN